jgi:hypothetical protein
VVSLEEGSLVIFYYLRASEIWPDKRGGPTISMNLKSGPIRGVALQSQGIRNLA